MLSEISFGLLNEQINFTTNKSLLIFKKRIDDCFQEADQALFSRSGSGIVCGYYGRRCMDGKKVVLCLIQFVHIH